MSYWKKDILRNSWACSFEQSFHIIVQVSESHIIISGNHLLCLAKNNNTEHFSEETYLFVTHPQFFHLYAFFPLVLQIIITCIIVLVDYCILASLFRAILENTSTSCYTCILQW